MIENIIISSIIDDPSILSKVKPEYFTNREILYYIEDLLQRGKPLDEKIIKSKFSNFKKEEIDPENIEEYIKNFRDQFVNSQIKKIGEQISKRDKIDEESFINYIDDFLNNIREDKHDSLIYLPDYVDEFLDNIGVENKKNGAIFGIETLDEKVDGCSPGSYIIVAGRPSMGKSSFINHAALHTAMKGIPVLLFSLEMSIKDIMFRIVSDLTEIEIWKIKRLSTRPEKEQKEIRKAAEILKTIPLFIKTTPGITVNQMQASIQKVKLQHGIGMVVLDYIQLMSSKGENENVRINNISKAMKNISIQYNIPVIAASQLSRLCEQRENKRPLLSDLRDSGGLEQDADIVIMLYREFYYIKNPDYDRILEVIIRKNRNGEQGKIMIDYNTKNQHFKPINYNSAMGKIAKRFEHE